MVDHAEPLSGDLSTLYPINGEPPLLEGAFQLRPICVEDTGDAERLVGAPGGAEYVVVSYNFTLSYPLFSCQFVLQQSYRTSSRLIALFPLTEAAMLVK